MEHSRKNMMKNKEIYDVIVVGMGASGLFFLSNLSSDIKAIGIEAGNSAGRKLLITGGGRCNLTNIENIKTFAEKYDKPSFARPILYAFNNKDLISWFEKRGILLVEENKKIYPKSMKAATVLNYFLSEIKNKKHEIFYNEKALSYSAEHSDYISLKTSKNIYFSKKIIISVGGASYPHTGSDGKFLTENFNIISFRSGLCHIYLKDNPFFELKGITITKVMISFDKKNIYGDLLFGGEFLSGPVVMDYSNYSNKGDRFVIDFLPDFEKEDIINKLKAVILRYPKKLAKTVFEDYLGLPKNFVTFICEKSFDLSTQSSNLKKKELIKFVEFLKNYSCEVKEHQKLKYSKVCRGGISTDLIDKKTMVFKKEPRLIFIGEALDVVGRTGGYNLQFAFSSAMQALRGIEDNI